MKEFLDAFLHTSVQGAYGLMLSVPQTNLRLRTNTIDKPEQMTSSVPRDWRLATTQDR